MSSVPAGYDTSPVEIVDPPARRRAHAAWTAEDDFAARELDRTLWFPHHLPHWSSRAAVGRALPASTATSLRCVVEDDQPPWCPEFDGGTRVSSLQTGVLAGPRRQRRRAAPVHRGRRRARGRRPSVRLFTPQYGFFELRARVPARPEQHGRALDDRLRGRAGPVRRRSASLEIFGRDVRPDVAAVGMGVHPFGDPRITDEWAQQPVAVDATGFHVYAVEWTPAHVAFFVDDALVTVVGQSPATRCSSCSASTRSRAHRRLAAARRRPRASSSSTGSGPTRRSDPGVRG